MKTYGFAAFALGAGLLAAPASAHHSYAMFDSTKETTLVGVVKEFQWTNPHIWLQFMARMPNGTVQEWSIEGNSLNSLARRGWRSTLFKPGDAITLKLHPLKSGEPGGSFVSATFADGRVVE